MSIFNRDIVERKLYFFRCAKCGKKKRRSFFKERAKVKLCAYCRRNQVPEGQESLLSEENIKVGK